eukprot:g1691.t1
MQEKIDNRDGAAVRRLQMQLDDAFAQGTGPGKPRLGSFDVMENAAHGNDPTDPHILLTERLEILIAAIVKVTSKGVVGEASAARVSALQAGLREGYTELRRHSNECPSLMRVRANYSNIARLVNKDLKDWGGKLYMQSSIFTGQHIVPPRASEFAAEIVPTRTWLTQYIRAGGLHNSQHLPPPRASAPQGGGGRSRKATPWGRGNNNNRAGGHADSGSGGGGSGGRARGGGGGSNGGGRN